MSLCDRGCSAPGLGWQARQSVTESATPGAAGSVIPQQERSRWAPGSCARAFCPSHAPEWGVIS